MSLFVAKTAFQYRAMFSEVSQKTHDRREVLSVQPRGPVLCTLVTSHIQVGHKHEIEGVVKEESDTDAQLITLSVPADAITMFSDAVMQNGGAQLKALDLGLVEDEYSKGMENWEQFVNEHVPNPYQSYEMDISPIRDSLEHPSASNE